ncbi:MAG: hypothetical protein MR227_05790 [Firmicutes bacterium]|nr:hypothetical protein [Bacillota bacterium]
MHALIKPKRFIILAIGFLLLPIIVPLLSNMIELIFNYGVEIGTYLRHLIAGYSC